MSIKITATVLTLSLSFWSQSVLAAAAWPADTAGTNIAAGLNTYNSDFEASGAAYSSAYGYIVNGDDGDLALLDAAGTVVQYWSASRVGGDLEDVTITDTTTTDGLVYLANESGSKIEQFDLDTGYKTGLYWNLSGLTVDGGSGFEALAYVPANNAPAGWGSATSGGFFLAASQAEAKIYVYNINTTVSGTVSSITNFAVTYTDVGALHYNTDTQLLYVVFDSDNKLKEYTLDGTIVNSYLLPTSNSEEGVVVVPNCASGNAQIGITNDASSSVLKIYENYPVTCVAAEETEEDTTDDTTDNSSDDTTYDYTEYDATDEEVVEETIENTGGATNGKLKVRFNNDVVVRYSIFNIDTDHLTQVRQHRDTAYYVVRTAKGKRAALVNAFTGEVLDRLRLKPSQSIHVKSRKLLLEAY